MKRSRRVNVGIAEGSDDAGDKRLRRIVYSMLVVIAGTMIAGRIAVVKSSTGEVPFLSANDRSRWCTIASLVDDGTYAIDRQVEYREPIRKRRVWYTIDMVRHRGADGQQHYYSSKPPLYPTMLAGLYAIFKWITGAAIMDFPFMVGRWLIVIANLLPMLGYFALMLSLVERFGKTDYGRLLAAATVTCGTLLVPFAISINNHLPGAISAAVALYCILRLDEQSPSGWLSFLAGLAAAFAAANELPALTITCLWGALFLLKGGFRSAILYTLGVALIGVAFFATNYYAHGSFRPPYMHRGKGAQIARFDNARWDDVASRPGMDALADAIASDETSRKQASLSGSGSEQNGDEALTEGAENPLEIRETTKPNLLEVWNPRTQMRYAADDQRWPMVAFSLG
ncbi:MAG: hypothetical protein R3C05_13550 [Pirellulaceae bacterium]